MFVFRDGVLSTGMIEGITAVRLKFVVMARRFVGHGHWTLPERRLNESLHYQVRFSAKSRKTYKVIFVHKDGDVDLYSMQSGRKYRVNGNRFVSHWQSF